MNSKNSKNLTNLMNPHVRAIIFDGSGTLLNDIEAVWRANSAAYESFGVEACRTLEEFRERFRLPITAFHLANGVPADVVKAVDAKFRKVYPDFARCVGLFPEVMEVLGELKRKGVQLGIASNIPSGFLKEHLATFEIGGFFDVVTGQEDCDEQKPSPKPILVTVSRMGARPEQAMYVGDMEEDIIAGKKAGALTAAVVRRESYHPRWRLERQKPDRLITSLKELL
ncbi:MAG: HAD family hydrolase [Chloroflexi bacterium]|nr:HAD family hydrolase [Chloroflexota bacterium]